MRQLNLKNIIKIHLTGSNVPQFRKSQKVPYQSTLLHIKLKPPDLQDGRMEACMFEWSQDPDIGGIWGGGDFTMASSWRFIFFLIFLCFAG